MKLLKSLYICKSLLLLLATLVMGGGTSAATPEDAGDALFESSMETRKALQGVFLSAVHAGDRMLLAGERGHIVYSDDNGDTWQQAEVPVRSTLTALFFLNAELGWAVGHDTVILASRDGGRNWSKQLDGFQATQLVHAAATERLASLEARSGEVQAGEVEAGEIEAEHLAAQLEFAEIALDEADRDLTIGPAKALMDIWFADARNGLAIGANGYLIGTEDGGASWQDWSQRVGNPDLMHLYKIVDGRDGVLYLIGEAGMAYRSLDAGASWELMELPYYGSLFGGLARASDNSVYLFGLSGVVLRSRDRGESWQFVPTNSKSILQSGTLDDAGAVLLVGLGGAMLRESDDQSKFEPLALGGRSALTGVLIGDGGRLVVAGEAGVRAFDAATSSEEESMKRYQSLRFMFHKRETN